MCTRLGNYPATTGHHVHVRGVVARKLRSVRFLRRSAEPEPAPAQAPPDTVRVGGKGRPTPKRRDAEAKRRGPAPPPPRTQREASEAGEGQPAQPRGPARPPRPPAARAWRAATTATSSPATAVRSRPTSATSSTPGRTSWACSCRWPLIVLLSVVAAVPGDAAVPEPLQPDLPRHDGHRGDLPGALDHQEGAGEVPERRASRASTASAGTPSPGPARSASSGCPSRGSRGAPTPEHDDADPGARRHAVGQVAATRRSSCPPSAPVRYLATARRVPGDAEWDARIDAHRARRPAGVDHASRSPDVRALLRAGGGPLLVDDLATWLTGVLDDAGAWERAPSTSPRRSTRWSTPCARRRAGSCWCRPRSGWAWCPPPGPGGCSATSWARSTPRWPGSATRSCCSSRACRCTSKRTGAG